MDAEDCVQESFLQWYASGSERTVENPKAFLCTVVTRRCIDYLRTAQVKRESYVGLWLPEPLLEADPSEHSELTESLSVAFLVLLEHLSPIERAVFLLRQVFDYDYAEIAAIVGKSAENCRQVMHRARRHLPLHRTFSQVSRVQQQQVFTQFLQACQDGDMEGLLRVLSDEIVLHTDSGGKISTARNPIYGPERVVRYLVGTQQKFLNLMKATIQPTLINGQPGLIGYLLEGDLLHQDALTTMNERKQAAWYLYSINKKREPIFVIVLTLAKNLIQEIDIIANPEKLRHIPSLPAEENRDDP